MDSATSKAVLDQINDWRQEAGIKQRVDAGALQRVLEEIGNRDVPEPLTLHIVLGCEWLFRPKKLGSEEVERVLSEVQDGLARNMSERAAYLVTQALAPAIGKLARKEKRTSASIGSYSHNAPLLIRSNLGKPGVDRKPPNDGLTRVRPGRIPWPAPWIAGAVMETILKQKGRDSGVVCDLVGALLGREGPVDPQEWKRHRQAFPEDALYKYARASEQGYRWLLSHESLDWQKVLQENLKKVNPTEVFPNDSRLVQALQNSYSSS